MTSGDGVYAAESAEILTHVGKVVDQDDFADQMVRGPVQYGMDGPQQDGPRLVVEAHDDRRLGQVVQISARFFAPAKRRGRYSPPLYIFYTRVGGVDNY